MENEQIQNLIVALEALIGLSNNGQSISEARVRQEIQNAKLNEARSEAVLTILLQIKQKQGDMVDAIKDIVDYLKKENDQPALKAIEQMADILKNAVISVTPDPEKVKGKDGYTPKKGLDYFTNDEVEQIIKSVLDKLPKIKDGYTPIKGKDYFDGKDGKTPVKGVDYFDGKDAIVDNNAIAAIVAKAMPKIEKQKSIEEIATELKGKLSYDDLKDLPVLYRQASRDYSFLELTDAPKDYKGQGGKSVAVKASEDGLEFVENKATDEKVKYDVNDPVAGYLSSKIIAGNGIGLAEGIGTNENKLVITNNGVITELDPVWNSEKANYAQLSQVWKINGNTVGVKKTIGNLDNFDFGILTNNLERVTVLANGNVGVGISSPAGKMHIATISPNRTSVVDGLLLENLSTGGSPYLGHGQGIGFYSQTYASSTSRVLSRIYSVANDHSGSTAGTDLAFQTITTNADLTPSTKMIIRYSGNVGIGTTAPGKAVSDAVTLAGRSLSIKATDYARLHVESPGGGAIDLIDNNASSNLKWSQLLNDTGKFYLRSIPDNGSGQTTILTADLSTSNLGIGITTPTAKLDINSDILRLRTAKTPATAGASGNVGDICWDNGYLYICVATNTWKRSALSTW